MRMSDEVQYMSCLPPDTVQHHSTMHASHHVHIYSHKHTRYGWWSLTMRLDDGEHREQALGIQHPASADELAPSITSSDLPTLSLSIWCCGVDQCSREVQVCWLHGGWCFHVGLLRGGCQCCATKPCHSNTHSNTHRVLLRVHVVLLKFHCGCLPTQRLFPTMPTPCLISCSEVPLRGVHCVPIKPLLHSFPMVILNLTLY